MSLTSQEHVQLPHLWLEVDGCTEEMESWGILLHSQVYEAQIIQNLPIEGCQVVGSFQAADSLEERGSTRWAVGGKCSRPSNSQHKPGKWDTHCHVFLLAKETHSDVIPEGRTFWNSTSYNSVFGEGNLKVPMGLHHAACRQDGLKTWDVENW